MVDVSQSLLFGKHSVHLSQCSIYRPTVLEQRLSPFMYTRSTKHIAQHSRPRASVFWSRGLQNSEHLRSVQKNTSGFPVVERCNSLLYSLSDIAVRGLGKSTGAGFRRKQFKKEIISRLGTKHSEGLNWFRSLHSNSGANAFTLKKGYT